MQDTVVRTALRVRYPEADKMGVAYHANYFVWFEMGRTELMRDAGCPYADLEERDGILFPVVALGASYRAPARYDERLTVVTRLVSVTGARVRFEYRVHRDPAGDLLATGFTEHGAVGRNGRPVRIPAELRRRLAAREAPA